MLTLKIEYLTGVVMATAFDDPSRSTPEWPPHPDRLYSALVAAAAHLSDAREGRLPSRARDALRWLAAQCWAEDDVVGPDLYASYAYRRLAPDVHMPSNPHEEEIWQKPKKGKPRAAQKSFDVRTMLPVHRKKTALPIPAVVPEEPAVYFVWNADPTGHLQTLREICERVTCLGRSRSLVRVSIVDDPPEPTYVPDPLGQVQLRVPSLSRLEELEGFYERKGGKPAPSSTHRYRRRLRDEPQDLRIIESIFERMYVFRPRSSDPVLPAESTLTLCKTLRKALIACIEAAQRTHDLEVLVPEIVHGHGQHPHCAYVALPFVHPRQRHADGASKGLAILIPRGARQKDLQAIALGLEALQKNGLGIPGVGTWHLQEVPEDDPRLHALATTTWRGPSLLWATVTPMEFGHFPKPKNGGEAKVVLDSLRMAGIDPDHVVEIAVSRYSPLRGAPPSWQFKPGWANDDGAPPRLLRHVMLRFDRPIAGPLLLGGKRYFGLGLMYPLRDR